MQFMLLISDLILEGRISVSPAAGLQIKRVGSCVPQERAAAAMWQQYQALTSPLSQQLCEQLRLILEPTQAAKLKSVP